MIYEGVFFSFDFVLSLVAVLFVPGGFKGDVNLLYRDFYHLGQNTRIPHLCCLRNGEPLRETYLPDWTPVLQI